MNAGAYGNNMSNIVKSVIVLNEKFQIKEIPLEKLKFDYRYSIFQANKNLICVAANIKLEHGNHDEIASKIKENLLKRKNSQPLEYPSAGSVFRNPEGNYAGKIIEELGLKGKNIGGAEISTKHANFIINKNNASSSDILKLIKLVQKEVKDKYKIDLILIPSIWAETFSYTTSEAIAMNVPVACFNLGGQADQVSVYPKGLILELSDSSDIVLDNILDFLRKLSWLLV